MQLTSTDIGRSMVEQLSNYVKALRQESSNIFEKLSDYSGFFMSDPDFMIKALPTETIDNLHKTAKLMVSAGFEKDFSDMYISCRMECLVESLTRLGFKKLNIEDIQMLSWKEIEDDVERWIKAYKVALKILFPTERRLCDRVFFDVSSTGDLSFVDVCREFTLQMLNFADAIAIGSRSPERLFSVIDMFETMPTAIWKRLGEVIRGIFAELADLIRQDPARDAVPDSGGLHPITHYVMNYLRATSRSRKTLEQVFEEDYGNPLKEYPKIEDRMHSSNSSLSVQIRLIMKLLESYLEANL
ncbi:hypothetical protein TSUD_246220 [Trifolium subterraneum]|uniref:Exocyst subunit Exo70 family protein n=1 Tax=Trifolium subterraneum TaxID=3900 RepID=A0A2Z6NL41_TRISU|nr:hypothetical protein TSUD_246220 [Trifolium subterraneum]